MRHATVPVADTEEWSDLLRQRVDVVVSQDPPGWLAALNGNKTYPIMIENRSLRQTVLSQGQLKLSVLTFLEGRS